LFTKYSALPVSLRSYGAEVILDFGNAFFIPSRHCAVRLIASGWQTARRPAQLAVRPVQAGKYRHAPSIEAAGW
jgi:hypothetical protein